MSGGSRIAVVLEPGRRGAAALAHAATLAAAADSELTVVAVAPKAGVVCRSCGGVSTRAFNCAVRDEVAAEMQRAITDLGSLGQHIGSRVLVEGDDAPLEQWIAEGEFDLVLLPAHGYLRRSPSHPAAKPLRRLTTANVCVVAR